VTQSMSYTEEQIEALIKDQISQEFMYDKNTDILTNDYPLIEQGIIDSMGIMRMINFLEEQFGITVEPEDFLLEFFETVNAIKSFTITKMQGSDAAKWA
jgi:acyl carrier protein